MLLRAGDYPRWYYIFPKKFALKFFMERAGHILPRAFVEKSKLLDFKLIKGIVGDDLTDSEIRAVLTRRDLILEEISRLIEK